MHSFLIITLTLLTSSTAVRIRNFNGRNCRSSTYGECQNVRATDCCDARRGKSYYTSSMFSGLPTTAIGSICTQSGRKNCGTVRQSGHGLSLCLTNGNSRGSYWFDCRSCRKREDDPSSDLELAMAHPALDSVEPDIVSIEGHRFYTNGSTPVEIRDAIFDYLGADALYVDIPETFRVYELPEPVGEDDHEQY
ncbi:hypothetical protein BO78DRAFT_435306 [Aspergillus sclerotiicarbonarius CBS 121057]|uniref:Uncharacterized protein n=1 Tax=Aspergillus sclerotiicarbonarius (strain CBS 121057 / IBT 28362) TaxID=1448318 RepID=A0A319ER63_ASPSB|nr:hypothetical protein BO78DRAFT_435306 [Aspergillus sclerotiicarbonarius CBS 121057]